MKNAIETLGADKVKDLVNKFAKELKIPPHLHIEYALNVCIIKPGLAPDINKKREKKLSAEGCVKEWVKKFAQGYGKCISKQQAKPPQTKADTAVVRIIQKVAGCRAAGATRIMYAHRLGMSAENILGHLLEEFLFKKLASAGWVMAWGSTITAVDFCNSAGEVLQVKNRDNTENSSSNKVREGNEEISLWVRGNSKNGSTNWVDLKDLLHLPTDIKGLNEDGFLKFIDDTLKKNPNIIALDSDSPYIKKGDK